LANLYEGMFLLDNQVVRENWKTAKAIVADTLTKHGAKVQTIRRWDERRLAYPIRTKQRATYFIAYYEMDGQAIPLLRRDLDLNEQVMRYLMLTRESVPEDEFELSKAENAEDFVVPEPPADDAPDEEPEEERKPEAKDAKEAEAGKEGAEGESAGKPAEGGETPAKDDDKKTTEAGSSEGQEEVKTGAEGSQEA